MISNKKYHYTYQITEINTNKKYIGLRSSNIMPNDDIGIHYLSSSSNKEFIKSGPVKKPVSIDGIRYNSLKEASISINQTCKYIRNRCRSDRWETWFYLT